MLDIIKLELIVVNSVEQNIIQMHELLVVLLSVVLPKIVIGDIHIKPEMLKVGSVQKLENQMLAVLKKNKKSD